MLYTIIDYLTTFGTLAHSTSDIASYDDQISVHSIFHVLPHNENNINSKIIIKAKEP